MDPTLELLIALESMDAQLDDFNSEEYIKSIVLNNQSGEGSFLASVEKLKTLREETVKKIPPAILRKYEKLRSKYGRGVAPVINGICTNCFMEFPSALVSRPEKNKAIESCPNCGIYVYWTK